MILENNLKIHVLLAAVASVVASRFKDPALDKYFVYLSESTNQTNKRTLANIECERFLYLKSDNAMFKELLQLLKYQTPPTPKFEVDSTILKCYARNGR